MYRKDSLDRFGDDLCQHVLSYAQFEERFRWQCVCKQWQRVIYRGQWELTAQHLMKRKLFHPILEPMATTTTGGNTTTITTVANNNGAGSLDPTASVANTEVAALAAYEQVLRKCSHLRHMEFTGNNRTLEAVIAHCPHLQSFHFTLGADITVQTIDKFFARFGRQLVSVVGETRGRYLCQKAIVRGVRHCPELQELCLQSSGENQTLRFLSGPRQELLFDKLQTLHVTHSAQTAGADDLKRLARLAATDGHRFRRLHLTVQRCDAVSVRSLADSLTQMSALIELTVDFKPSDDSSGQLLASLLAEVGDECRGVRRLELLAQVVSDRAMTDVVKSVNYHYRALRRLTIRGTFPATYVFTGAAIKRAGRRLTHLALQTCRTINPSVGDGLLATVDKTLPRLQCLRVSNANVTDAGLRAVARLERLQRLEIDYTRHQLANHGAIDAVRAGRKVRRILIRRQSVLSSSRHALVPNFYPQFYLNYPYVQMP